MTYPESKRIEAVTTYLVLGKMPLVASTIGVPLPTLKTWRRQAWWDELQNELQHESNMELDAKLAKSLDKALSLVNDRLENGDFMYDPKTGSFIRKPASLRDGWKVANEMIDRQWLIRKQPHNQTSQEEIGAILKDLANEFADMARKRVSERVIDAEVVSEADELNLNASERDFKEIIEDGQEPEQTELQLITNDTSQNS